MRDESKCNNLPSHVCACTEPYAARNDCCHQTDDEMKRPSVASRPACPRENAQLNKAP